MRLHLKSVEGKSRRSPEQKGPLKIIKPGTRFVREWQGEFHEVRAGTGGTFAYRGSDYTSLSVIARNITGARQSGPRFFGLKQSTENKIGERGHV